MKTKLFIDFDGTLFDTSGFKKEIFNIFKKAGYSETDVQKAYTASFLDYCYSIEEHFCRLQKIKKINPKLTQARIDEALKDTQKYLYDDSINFLENIDRKKYSVILITFGEVDFQKKKFEGSRLKKYFDDIRYTLIQKWDYLEKEKLVELNDFFIIIDDRGDTMEKISKKFKKSLAIEINREKNPTDPMEGESNYGGVQVKNFKQAEKYL